MKASTLTFKPLLIARGIIMFQPARAIPGRNGSELCTCKTTRYGKRLYTAQEVETLGYDSQKIMASYEATRLYALGIHVCDFCRSIWGVTPARDYRDAYTEAEAPLILCCGWCYAHVLNGVGARSPYALYGKGPRWAETAPGHSPWENYPRW